MGELTMPSSHTALDRTLSYRLHRLHKLTDLESQRAYPESTGLSLSDGRCLGAVGAFGPLSVNELARLSHLTKGQASRAAQALVERGLILKRDREEDGRGVSLSLTALGRKVWGRLKLLVEQRNQAIFSCLAEHERLLLSDLLDRLIAHAAGDDPDVTTSTGAITVE